MHPYPATVLLDMRRQRRALCPDEIARLLAAAEARPLIEVRKVRRGSIEMNLRPGSSQTFYDVLSRPVESERWSIGPP